MGRFSDPTSPVGGGRFSDPCGGKRMPRWLHLAFLSALFVVVCYVGFAWMRFSIVHTKAGEGAFFVHFKDVITFNEVPELQE